MILIYPDYFQPKIIILCSHLRREEVEMFYSKISSLQFGDFRKDLEKAGANAYVSKNRIAQLTLKDLGHEALADRISDQTAFVWSNEDSVAISKICLG